MPSTERKELRKIAYLSTFHGVAHSEHSRVLVMCLMIIILRFLSIQQSVYLMKMLSFWFRVSAYKGI